MINEQLDGIYRNYENRVNTYEALFKLEHHDKRRLDADLLHAKEVRNKSISSLIKEEKIKEHNHIKWSPSESKWIEMQADRIKELKESK